jgi:hypothetical protein
MVVLNITFQNYNVNMDHGLGINPYYQDYNLNNMA